MLRANLRGQIRQTYLPKWKPLLPLFEAVMNSVQSIQESPTKAHGKISIHIDRDRMLPLDDSPPISGFRVIDNGVGFTDENFDSFNTSYSEYKAARGGKGLGRFLWLKAFDEVEIKSSFIDSHSGGSLLRKFAFSEKYDPEVVSLPKVVDRSSSGTEVLLRGFKEPYKSECPKTAEQVCNRLIEHFILVLLESNCPSIVVVDGSRRLDVNSVFRTDFNRDSSEFRFQISGAEFTVRSFRLTAVRAGKNKLIYAANQREVTSDKLEEYLPNLSGKLVDEAGNGFYYFAVVQSPYLTQRVNHERTDFNIQQGEDADTSLLTIDREIRKSDIRDKCVEWINRDLADVIKYINDAKEAIILEYVNEEAPQYRLLMRRRAEFLDKIPASPSKPEIDTALHREMFQQEQRLRHEGARMIKEAEKLDDYEDYQARLSEFVERQNELGVLVSVRVRGLDSQLCFEGGQFPGHSRRSIAERSEGKGTQTSTPSRHQ